MEQNKTSLYLKIAKALRVLALLVFLSAFLPLFGVRIGWYSDDFRSIEFGNMYLAGIILLIEEAWMRKLRRQL